MSNWELGGAEVGWGRGWFENGWFWHAADALDHQSDAQVTAVPTDWSNQLKSSGGLSCHPPRWHAARSNDYWSSWGERGMWGGEVCYPWEAEADLITSFFSHLFFFSSLSPTSRQCQARMNSLDANSITRLHHRTVDFERGIFWQPSFT